MEGKERKKERKKRKRMRGRDISDVDPLFQQNRKQEGKWKVKFREK